ncbi:MAG: molybdenum cofactor biosynthesis protein MoaE [Planctomycetia bacterium]
MQSIRLTTDPIDYHQLVESGRGASCGAVILFLGTVRDLSENRPVKGLRYDAYPAMAEKKMAEVAAEARERWPLPFVGIIHRHGVLDLGDVAVAVVTSSAHRAEAFAAAEWIMDVVKKVVPIWKQENWADGSTDWIHPPIAVTHPSLNEPTP